MATKTHDHIGVSVSRAGTSLMGILGATSAAKIQTRISQLERASLYWGLLTLCSSKHA